MKLSTKVLLLTLTLFLPACASSEWQKPYDARPLKVYFHHSKKDVQTTGDKIGVTPPDWRKIRVNNRTYDTTKEGSFTLHVVR